MTLSLLIENYQILDDGGPASIVVPEAGLQVGRGAGMGWVLPDASRHISGHHFNVFYKDEDWWLQDVSTNGTFLQGHRHRIEGLHRLEKGQRFQVGQYIIVALMDVDMAQGGMNPASLPAYETPVLRAEENDDPWALGDAASAPIDPFPAERQQMRDDFAGEFMAFPAPPAAPASAVELVAAPRPVATDEAAFIRAFCEGAGLPQDIAADIQPKEFARMLGETLRLSAAELMQALGDRAAAKQFARVGERTMRGADQNNPLKFLPSAEQAIEAMFLRPRAGFQTGPSGFAEALRDLRLHQAALFAALQPALIKLLGDLAPEVIEAACDGGRLGSSRKTKAWDTFVQRWDAKTAPHENGVLDEFVQHFASAYRDAISQSGGERG